MVKLTTLDRDACLELVFERGDEFLRRIEAVEVFVARRFVDPDAIASVRNRSFEIGRRSEPSWHPLIEGCPDCHRLHADYPKAHVKARMHAFYYHGYYEHNAEVFALKNRLGGFPGDAHLRNTPGCGQVARVLLHHYPRGSGYQAEHVDPVSPFAKVQTIVQGRASARTSPGAASTRGSRRRGRLPRRSAHGARRPDPDVAGHPTRGQRDRRSRRLLLGDQ